MVRNVLIAIAIVIVLLLAAVVIAVNVIDPNDYRDEISSRAGARLGREVALNGPLAFKLFPWLALEIADVEVGNPQDFGAAPPLAQVGTARAALRLLPLISGRIETGNITLEKAAFALVTNRRGASNLEGLMQPVAEPAPATDLSALRLGAVRLRDVDLIVVDQKLGSRQEVHIDRFDLDPFRAGRAVDFALDGKIVSDGAALVERLAAVGNINVAADLSAVDIGSLNLEMAQGGQTIKLVLDQPLNLKLTEPMTVALPAAQLKIGGQRLDLAGNLKLAAAPSAELKVSGQRLDLAALAPPVADGESGGTAETTASAGGAQPAPADFSALKPWRALLEVHIDEVLLPPKLRLNDLVAEARLAGGVLTLKPLSAALLGGQFEGEASVDLNRTPPNIRIVPRLRGIQAGETFGQFSTVAPVRGTGDVALDLSFSGLDATAMLKTMSGRGNYRLTDGALVGVDLNRLIDEKLSVENAANISQAFGGETPFKVLEGRIEAQSGVIKTPGLKLDAGAFDVAGDGAVDFADESLAYTLNLNLGESLQQKLPSRLLTLTGGTIPLAIKGPIGAPLVTVDMAGIAKKAVQRTVEKQVDKLQEGVLGGLGIGGADSGEESGGQSKPKDVLKSLFGRKKKNADKDEGDDGGG